MAVFDHSKFKSLRTIIVDVDPIPIVRPVSPDRKLVVRFGVGGHPAQWVTHGTSGTKAEQRRYMRSWKEKVAMAAEVAMRHASGARRKGGASPKNITYGYVEVWADFVLNPSASVNPVHLIPDRTNLAKALEDALQGIVFPNDVMVIGGDVRRWFGPVEGVTVEVYSVPPLIV